MDHAYISSEQYELKLCSTEAGDKKNPPEVAYVFHLVRMPPHPNPQPIANSCKEYYVERIRRPPILA